MSHGGSVAIRDVVRAEAATTWLRWAAVAVVPMAVLMLPPLPGVEPRGQRLLAIFAATIAGFMTQPIAMGAVAVLALVAAAVTRSVTPTAVFAGFGNGVVWLVVAAFMIARALTESGLSRRVTALCASRLGSSPLRLAYALALADLLVAPVIPSDTARAGGLIFPVAKGLVDDGHPTPTARARRLGGFLMQSIYHVGVTTAATFLTSMAANPLIVELARQTTGVEITWGSWVLGSAAPALVALTLLPALVYVLNRPVVDSGVDLREIARERLRGLGRMSRNEWLLLTILAATVGGWVTQRLHGLPPAIVAYCGVGAALATGVLRWDVVLREHRAWDAMIWFGAVLVLAQALGDAGVPGAVSAAIAPYASEHAWPVTLILLVAAYGVLHYGFASMTAHIALLYPVFLLLAVRNGVPAVVAALSFAYFSNLQASVTHFGTGSGPILFGSGFVSQFAWWRTGFFVLVFHLVVWLGIGLLWWRLLGLY